MTKVKPMEKLTEFRRHNDSEEGDRELDATEIYDL